MNLFPDGAKVAEKKPGSEKVISEREFLLHQFVNPPMCRVPDPDPKNGLYRQECLIKSRAAGLLTIFKNLFTKSDHVTQ